MDQAIKRIYRQTRELEFSIALAFVRGDESSVSEYTKCHIFLMDQIARKIYLEINIPGIHIQNDGTGKKFTKQ